jgi:hypothetical protein
MDRPKPSGNRQAKLGSELSVRFGRFLTGECRTEPHEKLALILALHLASQSLQRPLEDGQGPAALEKPLGRQLVPGLYPEAPIAFVPIDRKYQAATSALSGAAATARIAEEMATAGEEVRAELPLLGRDPVQKPVSNHPRKESLGEVETVVGRMAAAAYVGVKRIPVGAAKLVESIPRAGIGAVPGRQDDAPACGVEIVPRSLSSPVRHGESP